MKKNIDKMLVILPFEADYFQKRWNWKVTYVGHPLVNVIEKRSPEPLRIGNDLYAPTQKVIALLPGSRKQEIAQKLPVMLQVSALLPKEIFVVAKAPGIDDPFYASFLNDYANVLAVRDQTYSLLKHAKAALVTSGTATLETALFGVPQVVCYKGNALSYWIAKKMLTIRYIALVNLILNKPVVKELIQHDFTVEKLLIELNELLGNPVRRAAIDADYAVLKQMLQQNGHDASRKAAEEIITHLRT